MAFLYPCVTRGAEPTRPQQLPDDVQSRGKPAAGRLVLNALCAGFSSPGSLTLGKPEAELVARDAVGKPREEAASLVSADLGTQQLLMDGVRPGQAPWELHHDPLQAPCSPYRKQQAGDKSLSGQPESQRGNSEV